MPDAEGPIVLGPGEGQTIQNPVGGPVTFKVRGEQTDGSWTVFETMVAPKEGPPLHVHSGEDEALYVLHGDFRFKLDADVRSAPAGSFVFVPRGTPHCFQNVGDEAARMLVVFSPAGMERFFDRFAALPDESMGPEAFRRIGSEIGMDVIGPPLAQSDPL